MSNKVISSSFTCCGGDYNGRKVILFVLMIALGNVAETETIWVFLSRSVVITNYTLLYDGG